MLVAARTDGSVLHHEFEAGRFDTCVPWNRPPNNKRSGPPPTGSPLCRHAPSPGPLPRGLPGTEERLC